MTGAHLRVLDSADVQGCDSHWFIAHYPQTHPWFIKRIGTFLLDHAPGAPTIFSIVKLAKMD